MNEKTTPQVSQREAVYNAVEAVFAESKITFERGQEIPASDYLK